MIRTSSCTRDDRWGQQYTIRRCNSDLNNLTLRFRDGRNDEAEGSEDHFSDAKACCVTEAQWSDRKLLVEGGNVKSDYIAGSRGQKSDVGDGGREVQSEEVAESPVSSLAGSPTSGWHNEPLHIPIQSDLLTAKFEAQVKEAEEYIALSRFEAWLRDFLSQVPGESQDSVNFTPVRKRLVDKRQHLHFVGVGYQFWDGIPVEKELELSKRAMEVLKEGQRVIARLPTLLSISEDEVRIDSAEQVTGAKKEQVLDFDKFDGNMSVSVAAAYDSSVMQRRYDKFRGSKEDPSQHHLRQVVEQDSRDRTSLYALKTPDLSSEHAVEARDVKSDCVVGRPGLKSDYAAERQSQGLKSDHAMGDQGLSEFLDDATDVSGENHGNSELREEDDAHLASGLISSYNGIYQRQWSNIPVEEPLASGRS